MSNTQALIANKKIANDTITKPIKNNNRDSNRINCAIPINFTVNCPIYKQIKFSAYILNMSKNGIYVEYLDTKHQIKIMSWEPVNLDVLEIKFHIPNTFYKINVGGRIVHKCIAHGQIGMGIEFKEMASNSEQILEGYIEERLMKERR